MPVHAVLQRKCLCTTWIRTSTNKKEYTIPQNVKVRAKYNVATKTTTTKENVQNSPLKAFWAFLHKLHVYTALRCEHVGV